MRRGMALGFIGMAACGTEPAPERSCVDPGIEWENADGRVNGDILTLAIAPDGTVLAGTTFGVVALDGSTREWGDRVDFDDPVRSIAIDPADPQHVLAFSAGIHESRDGGATWTARRSDDGRPGVIAFAPGIADRAYAVFADRLWRSDDAAGSWTDRPLGELDAAHQIAVTPGNDTVCATVTMTLSSMGAFCMFGGDLERAFSMSEEAVDDIAIAPDGAVYMVRRTTGLTRWDNSGGPNAQLSMAAGMAPIAVAVDPARPGALFLAGTGRIHASTDGGETWNERLDYAPVGWPKAMEVGPDGTLYVAAGRGSAVVVLDAAGDEVHWYGGGISGAGRDLPDPVDGLLFAASTHGVFVSAHAGVTWGTIGTELPIDAARGTPSLITAPSDPAILYAHFTTPAGTWSLSRTDDMGMSWVEVSQRTQAPDLVDPLDAHTLYWVEDGWLAVSDDGGERRILRGIGDRPVTDVFADHGEPGSILVATGVTSGGGAAALFRVRNRGVTEALLLDARVDLPGEVLGRVRDVHATWTGDLLVSFESGALARRDAGGSWTRLEPSFGIHPAGEPLFDFTASPSDPRVVFALASGRIYRSDDLGDTWCLFDETLPSVSALTALGGTPATLIASTGDRLQRIAIEEGD